MRHSTEKQGAVTFLCCNLKYKLNTTRARRHFLACIGVRKKFPHDFAEINESTSTTSSSIFDSLHNQSSIYQHFNSLSSNMRARIDLAFANSVIQDGIAFNSCQIKNCKPFWELIFGQSYRLPTRSDISVKFLPLYYNYSVQKCSEKIQSSYAFCLSIDGFSDVNSRSVFHTLVGFPIPLHISSFRLGSERESAINVNKKLHDVKDNATKLFKFEKLSVYGLVSDSPNVMSKIRKSYTGALEGGIKIVAFEYGSACHLNSLVIKDILKIGRCNENFKDTAKWRRI